MWAVSIALKPRPWVLSDSLCVCRHSSDGRVLVIFQIFRVEHWASLCLRNWRCLVQRHSCPRRRVVNIWRRRTTYSCSGNVMVCKKRTDEMTSRNSSVGQFRSRRRSGPLRQGDLLLRHRRVTIRTEMYTDTRSHAHFFFCVAALRRIFDALRALQHFYGSRSDTVIYHFHIHDLTLLSLVFLTSISA